MKKFIIVCIDKGFLEREYFGAMNGKSGYWVVDRSLAVPLTLEEAGIMCRNLNSYLNPKTMCHVEMIDPNDPLGSML